MGLLAQLYILDKTDPINTSSKVFNIMFILWGLIVVPQCIAILVNVAQLPTVIALSNLPCCPLGCYTAFGEMSGHLTVKANLELSFYKFGVHCRVLFILIQFEFLVFFGCCPHLFLWLLAGFGFWPLESNSPC